MFQVQFFQVVEASLCLAGITAGLGTVVSHLGSQLLHHTGHRGSCLWWTTVQAAFNTRPHIWHGPVDNIIRWNQLCYCDDLKLCPVRRRVLHARLGVRHPVAKKLHNINLLALKLGVKSNNNNF